MQGSKYSDEQREMAKQLLAAGTPVPEIEKTTSVKRDSLYRWKANLQKDENFQKLAEEKKDEFVETATRIIDKGMQLIERKLDKMLDSPDCLKEADITKITTTVGTIFDKRALARGEATENVNVNASFETFPEIKPSR